MTEYIKINKEGLGNVYLKYQSRYYLSYKVEY